MIQPLSVAARPAPCCATITPTRTSGLFATLDRFAERVRDAMHALMPRRQTYESLPALDDATLRDLGLSPPPAAWLERGRSAHDWR